jgi:hypothetical protein
MTQLKLSTSTIRVVDYVETYHLLLDICRAENNPAAAVSQPQGKDDGDPISWPSNVASGDELCTLVYYWH